MKHIPRIIHMFVTEQQDIPARFAPDRDIPKSEQSRQWHYKLWNEEAVTDLLHTCYPGMAESLTSRNIAIADIAGYVILHAHGGVFAKRDFRCDFDAIAASGQCCLITSRGSSPFAMTDVLMAAVRGHPFFDAAINTLKDTAAILDGIGKAFIHTLYSQYQHKDEIALVPTDSIRTKPSTDVLYFSTYNNGGGQSVAANRIHKGLRSIGINCNMLVLGIMRGNPDDIDGVYIAGPQHGEPYGPRADNRPLKEYSISRHHKISPAVAGVDPTGPIEIFNPQIVQMHWIADGFVKIEDLPKMNRKIVWRLADCWAFTGGCFYPEKCDKYATGCHNCHKLHSGKDDDLSRSVWERKLKAYKELDLTIVVPSVWMKEMVKRSALLKDREVVVIPNGLDLNTYYPEDKTSARRALGIPLDKKIIVFGAGSPNNPRKGFDMLREALSGLAAKHPDKYYLVVFGGREKPAEIDIPMKYMGSIRTDQQHLLRTIYSAGDVMIVPSREESFGQTVTEAMACGTPVVSFLHTGPASAVEHQKSGYLANYADTDDLAGGIEWVLADAYRLKALSENARRRIETTFDIKIVARQYQELYERLLHKPIGRR